ncbi:MAG: hypothetical protein V9E98_10360 [Candidatus Nanopelagicales bacterium]
MNKKAVLAVGASALLALGTAVPMTSASAGAGIKGKKCQDGTFHVLHNDSINQVRIKEGYYLTYVKGVSCYQASTYLHDWLAQGYTSNNFLVASGTRGKKSTMFIQGQSGPFFQIKRVNGPQ